MNYKFTKNITKFILRYWFEPVKQGTCKDIYSKGTSGGIVLLNYE